jgi:pyruvate/2-oxoglutarate/acetoin dehydrogenase E1 component/TPP-dependent pyruvate/acetoin dehydrogenase alpha subunit
MQEKTTPSPVEKNDLSFEELKKIILNDYRVANESRQASLWARKEVLTGKAKFGISGDGKEIAQLAMAKAFRKGDFRSGYYRDQTFMFALGELTIKQYFAQLYAHPDLAHEPATAGRCMTSHFSTHFLNADGSWKKLSELYNSACDISPTASQMPRLVGLAWASKLFRQNKDLHPFTDFSLTGNEVAFGTIGDASTSEGIFFESLNAAGVLQIPMAVSVWDDGYGISVPTQYQTTKQSISEALRGFERNSKGEGILIFKGKGWDYPGLCEMYEKGIAVCRKEHVPVLFHIQEVTQPQGHSTSGSHERYKSKERLQWEEDFDPIRKMREWILSSALATTEELDTIEAAAKKQVNDCRKEAWNDFTAPIKANIREVSALFDAIASEGNEGEYVLKIKDELSQAIDPMRRELMSAVRRVLHKTRSETTPSRQKLAAWEANERALNHERYSSHLFSESRGSALLVAEVKPKYEETSPLVDGREVLNANFDTIFRSNPLTVAFGEDVGKIGGVNQAFAGLQAKYGEIRITDTGIREATIIGQGIGLAMRGLRPIAEIQYLDYLLYALQIMSDDLATLRYRTKGTQKAPVIIRTRGHRLEGIWHSGSPMGMIIHSLRGLHILVPRNMTKAAGFYNTLLASDEPGLIIEPLNSYRLKEKLPSNPGEYCTPLGVPEVLSEGTDLTIVTYGSCCRIVMEAVSLLNEYGISCEVIDLQSLLPFDVHHSIVESLKKTNRLLVVDEDVPGGASGFILQQILEVQKGYFHLDTEPRTLTAKEHRPAYGSDGDYFSKPNTEDVFEMVYSIMNDSDPEKFPAIYQ